MSFSSLTTHQCFAMLCNSQPDFRYSFTIVGLQDSRAFSLFSVEIYSTDELPLS